MDKSKIYNTLLMMCLVMGCQVQDNIKTGSHVSETDVEQFNVFYKKFHGDSLFQMSRIKFPLRGINTDQMTVEDTIYYWKENEWLMHHIVDTALFDKKISTSGSLAVETITSKDPGVVIKRKFQKIKGKWYLVLYEDVNL